MNQFQQTTYHFAANRLTLDDEIYCTEIGLIVPEFLAILPPVFLKINSKHHRKLRTNFVQFSAAKGRKLHIVIIHRREHKQAIPTSHLKDVVSFFVVSSFWYDHTPEIISNLQDSTNSFQFQIKLTHNYINFHTDISISSTKWVVFY